MLADHFPFRKQLSENCCLFFNENGEKAKDFSWLRCLKESHLRTPRDDTTEWGGREKKQCMQNSKNSPLNPDLLSILSSGLIWCILFNFQPSDSEWMSCNWCSCALSMQTESHRSLLSADTLLNTYLLSGSHWESTLHCLNIILLKALLEGQREVRRNTEKDINIKKWIQEKCHTFSLLPAHLPALKPRKFVLWWNRIAPCQRIHKVSSRRVSFSNNNL